VQPTTGIEPLTEIRVRFSEPMDPKSVTAHDSFMVLSNPDTPLPEAVAEGREPFMVVGAVAGGRLTT